MGFRFWPALAGVLFFAHVAVGQPMDQVTVVTAQGRQVFKVEIAATPAAQQKGLMFRRAMAADAGMLFVFRRQERRSFWMKNTLIPLDMLFIDAGGRIVAIHRNAQPQSLTPISPRPAAKAVFEINGGLARRLGIAVGDQVLHPSLKR